MSWLTAMNSRLSRWAMYIACLSLSGLLAVVVFGVVRRYIFNDAPPYVEQVALLLIISVAMFGAAAGVRDAGHIGMDSLVAVLPERAQFWCSAANQILALLFGVALIIGGGKMAISTYANTIPTLGISEAFRYLPGLVAGSLIILFSIEHLIAQFSSKKVIASWH
jgi:TRAP-type transport system small permease protein